MQLTPVLLLSEPVRFVKKLQDTSYHLGAPLSLMCTYTGSQQVHVSWMKDGKPIWASYKYNVKTTKSSCILEVLNSDREEAAGVYSCQVSNAGSSAICDAYVICKTTKKGTGIFHSLTLTIKAQSKSFILLLEYKQCLLCKGRGLFYKYTVGCPQRKTCPLECNSVCTFLSKILGQY